MRTRLDVYLAEQNLCKSREQARALIMAGQVYINGVKAEKAGQPLPQGAEVVVKENPLPFVSRGGLKLQKALEEFPISLEGVVAADIGASTGGFTDCMLQHGARRVFAVDVGYGQLDWRLRNDPRVTVMERTNARYMEPGWFGGQGLDFACVDVSFISLEKILPPLLPCLAGGGQVVALVKPQFEAGREHVGKHGVVSDPDVHKLVCARVVDFAKKTGYQTLGLSFSPIKGPKGNIEFLLWLGNFLPETQDVVVLEGNHVADVVYRAHIACIS